MKKSSALMKHGAIDPARLNRLPRGFAALNEVWPLRPIRDDVDLANAQEIMDVLAVTKNRTRDQDDYLESLVTLVQKYEEDDDDYGDLSPIDVLRDLLEANDMSGSDLGRLLGNRELGPAILRGDRQLSKANIAVLVDRFKVSADLFLRR